MKPFMNNLDLLKLLPWTLFIYTGLYVIGVGAGTGPVPPLSEYLGNVTLMFWLWVAAFVINTALYRVQVRRERREQGGRR